MRNRPNSLAEHVYEVISRRARDNSLLSHATLSSLNSPEQADVFVTGGQIKPKVKELIVNANSEVLIQFYNYDDSAEEGRDIKLALVTLNEKSKILDEKIKVRIQVNFRKGPAAFFTGRKPDPFTWIKTDTNGTFINLDNSKYYINDLDIDTQLHVHYFFDSYHTKQFIIDRKTLMLRSGDVTKHTDSDRGENTRIELATVVNNADLAERAAANYHARWNDDEKNFAKLYATAQDEDEENHIPVLLLEKTPSTNPKLSPTYLSPYKIAVIEAIRHTKKSIKMTIPNLNDPQVIQELIGAIKRGVIVQLVIGKFHNDSRESKPGLGGTNLQNIDHIYHSLPISLCDNFQVNWATDDKGSLVIEGQQFFVMHGKALIFDDKTVIAGSSALDKQSTCFSSESDVLIESEAVASKFSNKVFLPAYTKGKNYNLERLDAVKTALIKDIGETFIQPNKLEDKEQICVESLTQSILNVENFSALASVLKISLAKTEVNPLAKTSNQGLFGNKNKIEDLAEIYKKNITVRCHRQ